MGLRKQTKKITPVVNTLAKQSCGLDMLKGLVKRKKSGGEIAKKVFFSQREIF